MDLPFGNELPDLDVLIVGAGLSGLTSAVKILSKESSLNLRIIDESSSPGGQLDMEGTRFINEQQTELIDFLTQLNVATRAQDQEQHKLNRCWELDRGLLASPAKFELWRYIDMLDQRMKMFNALRYNYRKRVPTMERHICNNLFFNRSRRFMYNLVELASGVPASDINYDEFMGLCSTMGGLTVVIELFLTMPKSIVTLSCKTLLDALIKKLKNVKIKCGVKAVKVTHFKNYVQVTDSSGTKYIAEAVILAIPWDMVNQIDFEPQIPKRFQPPSRTSVKPKSTITQYFLRYDKPYWTSSGYSGHFLNIHPMVVGYECRPREYCGYVLHSAADSDGVLDTVLELLAAKFGDGMRDPLENKLQTCQRSIALDKPQIKPWNRVVWSGSAAVATTNRNLMGGAVESGIRSAINALFVIRPQVVSWRDLLDVQEKKRYSNISPGFFGGLVSRLNLYNITFYSVFVVGLICLLSFGYNST